MELDELHDYLFRGEDETLEFKQQLTSEYKIAKTICAFSNSKGGTILVGVKDNKSVCGIDPEEEKHILEKAAQFHCNPPVSLDIQEIYHEESNEDYKEKIILKVNIPPSNERPHFAESKPGEWNAYIREHDKTLIAGKKTLRMMKIVHTQPKTNHSLSANEKKLVEYLKDNNRIDLKKYVNLVNISQRRGRRELHDMLSKGIIKVMEHEKEDYYVLN